MTNALDHSADFLIRDGILRRSRVVGHSDEAGRIRERDGAFFRGEEVGVADDRGRIRRKGGIVGRGEAIARLRGNAVYSTSSILSSGRKLGHVDSDGRIWQADCDLFSGREIGRVTGSDPEMGLAFFTLKFLGIADHVVTLETKVVESEDRAAFLPRVRATLNVLPEVDALGDFDDLVRRLRRLDRLCLREMRSGLKPRDDAAPEAGDLRSRTLSRLTGAVGEGRVRRAEALYERARDALGDAAEDTLRKLNVEDPAILEAELIEELHAEDLHAVEPSLSWAQSPAALVREAVQRLATQRGSERRGSPDVSRSVAPGPVQDAVLVQGEVPANDQIQLAQIRAKLEEALEGGLAEDVREAALTLLHEALDGVRADDIRDAVVSSVYDVLSLSPEEQVERLRNAAERLAAMRPSGRKG